ncbi:MAG: DUF4173 domain-containing protein [Clostridiales bacterium]|nr:DUF4173 domain-containing protein [Clostridiales bacterium]
MESNPLPTKIENKPRFSVRDLVLALVLLGAGYGWAELLPATRYPLGGVVFVAALLGIALIYFRVCRSKLTAYALCVGAVALVFAAAPLLGNTWLVRFPCFTVSLAACYYFVYLGLHPTAEQKLSDLFFFEMLKTHILLPFGNFGCFWRALFARKQRTEDKKGMGVGLWILLGLCAAVVPTMIIGALLSADSAFAAFWDRFIDFDLGDWFWKTIVAILFAMWVFGLYFGAGRGRFANVLTEENRRSYRASLRFAPRPFVIATLAPVFLLYLLFFISQGGYLFPAFYGLLPADFTLATFARQGFGYLCGVAFINALYALALCTLQKKEEGQKNGLARGVIVALCAVTLLLIASALARMALYIGGYGLTLDRVYATWFILVLAVGFVLLLIKQFREQFQFTRWLVLSGLVMLLGLTLLRPVNLVANYNVNAYLSGRLEEIDVHHLGTIGDDALPHLLRLRQARGTSDEIKEKVDKVFSREAGGGWDWLMVRSDSPFAWSLSSARRQNAINEWKRLPDRQVFDSWNWWV